MHLHLINPVLVDNPSQLGPLQIFLTSNKRSPSCHVLRHEITNNADWLDKPRASGNSASQSWLMSERRYIRNQMEQRWKISSKLWIVQLLQGASSAPTDLKAVGNGEKVMLMHGLTNCTYGWRGFCIPSSNAPILCCVIAPLREEQTLLSSKWLSSLQ